MNTQQKASLINAILQQLKFAAKNEGKAFDEGGTWFSLAFLADAELKNIAKLAGV